MKHSYQCKICLETFPLLRYLRKHVTIPAVAEHQPNECQSYYSRTGTLQENLKVNHKIAVNHTTNEKFHCRPKSQRVKLISTNTKENKSYSEDDDCRIIEDEHACLKFEPDEEDKFYLLDRENPILPYNGIANNSPQAFVNNKDKAKENNHEANIIETEEHDEESIKPAISQRNHSQTRQIGIDVVGANKAEVNSPGRTTICNKCKLACTSLENLCIHYETLHKLPVVVLARVVTNKGNPKCKRTEAGYSEEPIGQTKTHKCGICSKTFTTLYSLKRHKSCIHDGKIFQCNVCQKTFHWLDSLKNHKLSAHDGRRYKCNICAKKFNQLENLNRHKSCIHDNVRFKCDVCQKEFKRLDNLKVHKLNLHEHAVYKCNKCPKQFHSAQGLRFHKASVHKGILYTCEQCQTKVRHKTTLREHMESIHGGIRYKCDTCPKEYSYLQALRRHKSVEHNAK